jgi:hypothetical protein
MRLHGAHTWTVLRQPVLVVWHRDTCATQRFFAPCCGTLPVCLCEFRACPCIPHTVSVSLGWKLVRRSGRREYIKWVKGVSALGDCT